MKINLCNKRLKQVSCLFYLFFFICFYLLGFVFLKTNILRIHIYIYIYIYIYIFYYYYYDYCFFDDNNEENIDEGI